MATLRNLADGRERTLGTSNRIGRARDATLTLVHPSVSTEHALLRFTADGWEIKDLGSRNGTIADGVRLAAGASAPIDLGSQLVFGDDAETWELINADAPALAAIDVASGARISGKNGLLVLPSEERVECSIYALGAEVVIEGLDGESSPARDGAVITAGGRSYRLELPSVIEGTPLLDAKPTLHSAHFRFKVSRDEETVAIDVLHRGRTIALDAQWHSYVLLTLARLRHAARDQALDDRGWIGRDKLLKMLRMDANNLNVAIHKAREALLDAGIDDAVSIVEVKRGLRRFGSDRFEVVPLE